ncbi:MAG: RDD family protein [Erythrobacter sp.]
MDNYAGFWIRVGAYLIDTIIILIAQTIIFAAFGVSLIGADALDPAAGDAFANAGGGIAYLITTVGGILYFAIMESSAKQGTLGKMALGLVVTDIDGNRISFLRALGRYFAKILSGLILLIGYIMVAFTERKQGLHDMICSTLVLKAKPGETGVDTTVFE